MAVAAPLALSATGGRTPRTRSGKRGNIAWHYFCSGGGLGKAPLVAAFFALVALCGCGRVGDYSVELPGDYKLVRTNGYTRMIVTSRESRDRRCIVPPDIQQVGVWDDYVFGRVASVPRSDLGPTLDAGYFLLDTSSGEVLLGLDEEEWRSVMHEGIGTRLPHWLLTKPNRLGRRLTDIMHPNA